MVDVGVHLDGCQDTCTKDACSKDTFANDWEEEGLSLIALHAVFIFWFTEVRFSWATKINLTCREEQFHRHQLHFMMYKRRCKCAMHLRTRWHDMCINDCCSRCCCDHPMLPKRTRTCKLLVKSCEDISHFNTIILEIWLNSWNEFLSEIHCRHNFMKLCARLGVSQKRHEPGKILCATILGWLYYVIFIFVTLFSRGVI